MPGECIDYWGVEWDFLGDHVLAREAKLWDSAANLPDIVIYDVVTRAKHEFLPNLKCSAARLTSAFVVVCRYPDIMLYRRTGSAASALRPYCVLDLKLSQVNKKLAIFDDGMFVVEACMIEQIVILFD